MAIKEFRDEELPHRPCYQAMVGFDRELCRWTEEEGGYSADKLQLESLPGRYSVTFKSSPSWPIIEKLGLKHREVRSQSGAPVAVCDVVDPFWIRANIRAHLSGDLIHRRIDTGAWTEVSREAPNTYIDAQLDDSWGLSVQRSAGARALPQLRELIQDLYKLSSPSRSPFDLDPDPDA